MYAPIKQVNTSKYTHLRNVEEARAHKNKLGGGFISKLAHSLCTLACMACASALLPPLHAFPWPAAAWWQHHAAALPSLFLLLGLLIEAPSQAAKAKLEVPRRRWTGDAALLIAWKLFLACSHKYAAPQINISSPAAILMHSPKKDIFAAASCKSAAPRDICTENTFLP